MKAFRKDFFREILRNKGRFLSVFFISLLGAAFFSGIRSAEGDMKTSADAYYDQTNYMDLRVLGTLGLTDTDMEDIAKVKGVAQVTGGHTLEVLHKEGEKEQTVKLIALEDGVNEPQILDGRLPQKTDEILVDQKFLDETGKKIGDQVIFESGTDTALSDDLVHGTFTIVGSATLPYYMELTRGTGSIGNGSIDSFGLLLPKTFTSEIYTEIYVQVDGAKELESYSTSYEKTVKQVQNRVEELEEEACQRRYDTVYQEGEDKLSDARKQVTDGEKELADGKKKLEDGTLQIEEAKDTVAEKEKELKELLASMDQAEQVSAMIKALDKELTLEDEQLVVRARNAYDALTETEKAMVENLDILTKAEEKISQMKENKEKADAVIRQIEAIGDVTLDSREEITAAREAFQALTESQQALVPERVRKLLENAEKKITELLEKKDRIDAFSSCVKRIPEKVSLTDDSLSLLMNAHAAWLKLNDEERAQVDGKLIEQIKEKEAERVRKVLKDSAYTIALAIDGKQMTSENFAEKIQGLGIRGESHICFLIGGSLGMSDSLLRQADERISFSKMTFPHQLMRVILLEQIYRGFRIIHHEPYHK